jgi:hypothetical protein
VRTPLPLLAHRSVLLPTLLSVLLPVLVSLFPADALADGGLRYSTCKVEITVADDGSDTRLSEQSWDIADDAGAQQSADFPIFASSAPYPEREVIRADTITPDGQRIAAVAIDNRPGPRALRLQRTVPGSRVEVVIKAVLKDQAPQGHYQLDWIPDLAIDPRGCELLVSAPASLPIRIGSTAGVKGGALSSADGRRRWKWTVVSSSMPGDPDFNAEKMAHVELTTFKDAAEKASVLQAFLAQKHPERPAAPVPTRPPLPKMPAGTAANPTPFPSAGDFRPIGVPPDVGTQFGRPEPEWFRSERAFFRGLLSKGHFDTLVLPAQSRGFGLDRTIRAIMAAEIAAAIRESGDARVPEPSSLRVRSATAGAH